MTDEKYSIYKLKFKYHSCDFSYEDIQERRYSYYTYDIKLPNHILPDSLSFRKIMSNIEKEIRLNGIPNNEYYIADGGRFEEIFFYYTPLSEGVINKITNLSIENYNQSVQDQKPLFKSDFFKKESGDKGISKNCDRQDLSYSLT